MEKVFLQACRGEATVHTPIWLDYILPAPCSQQNHNGSIFRLDAHAGTERRRVDC